MYLRGPQEGGARPGGPGAAAAAEAAAHGQERDATATFAHQVRCCCCGRARRSRQKRMGASEPLLQRCVGVRSLQEVCSQEAPLLPACTGLNCLWFGHHCCVPCVQPLPKLRRGGGSVQRREWRQPPGNGRLCLQQPEGLPPDHPAAAASHREPPLPQGPSVRCSVRCPPRPLRMRPCCCCCWWASKGGQARAQA